MIEGTGDRSKPDIASEFYPAAVVHAYAQRRWYQSLF